MRMSAFQRAALAEEEGIGAAGGRPDPIAKARRAAAAAALEATGPSKKTSVAPTIPSKPGPKFTLADMRRVSNRKANLIRAERNRLGNIPNLNEKLANYNVEAEMKAIRNIEALKMAGLLTPTPSPKPIGRPRATKVASRNNSTPLNVSQSPGGRIRIGRKLCSSYKKDDLIAALRKLGIRADSKMTIKELCELARPNRKPSPKPVRVIPSPRPVRAAQSPKSKPNKRTIKMINTEPDCMTTRKSDLLEMARARGIPGALSRMTVKELCCALKKAQGHVSPMVVAVKETAPSLYVRGPNSNMILNVTKNVTYGKYTKPNLTKLVKLVGIKGYSKNKKDQLITRLYEKLAKNMANYLTKVNRSTVTQRQIAEALAKNYGWKNNRHVERSKIFELF